VQIFDGDGHLLADGSSLCFIRSLPVEAAAEAPATPSAPPDSEPEPPRLFERPALGEIVGQDVWDRMSGLEFFEARLAGELPNPPIHYLTGAGPVEVGAGEAIFTMPCHEWLCTPRGTVEGGSIAMVADAALSSAIQTTLPAGAALAAIDLKVNFLRPVAPDGRELLSRGRVRHAGRTIAVAEAEVVNADEKTVALATGSAMILTDRPATLGHWDQDLPSP
jgi:uncharacterized protein (TIGR00369 family)